MQDITYMGQKALLITSDDLIQFDRNPKAQHELVIALTLARKNYRWVFVVTSLKKKAIPKILRTLLNQQKNCYVGQVPK